MYQKTHLENGVRIVTEKIPYVRTVSVGIWVDVGSRDEHEEDNGSAHFVEHMLFKGTKKRSARRIAMELDVLGGMSNAFTSRELTCFYATIIDSNLHRLVDLFIDMFLDSRFDPEEVTREQQVILQEISMVDDTPDDLIHDLFSSELWGDHSLGRTVLGTRGVVGSMDSARLREFIGRLYTPERILIAAAGNVDHDHFVRMWEERFGKLSRISGEKDIRTKPAERPPSHTLVKRPLEQVHTILGTYGLPIDSEERYKLILLNIILGGNMSSRLFQEVREKRGLAYSIYSYLDSYIDAGCLAIYMGVGPAFFHEATNLVVSEVERLTAEAVSEKELANAKDYAKGGLLLASENMEARMTRIARNEVCFGRYFSFDEVADDIDRVTSQEVTELAGKIFSRKLTRAVLGPVSEDKLGRKE